MRALLICLFLWLPGLVTAQCTGTDLRPMLTEAEAAELARAEANTPFASGNHWRAERGDQVIHIFGTMHVGDPRMAAIVARHRGLIDDADLLFLEVSPEEEKRLEELVTTDPSLLLLTKTTLPEELDEETWQMLADAARARGLPPFMAAKMQPWYLSVMLSLPACMIAQLSGGMDPGLDDQFTAVAEAVDTPIRGLETVEDTITIFTEQPFEKQMHYLVTSVVPNEVSADMMATTTEQYFEEANAQSWALAQILARHHASMSAKEITTAFNEFETDLLTNRNQSWIRVIDAAQERRIVVAVGALHLMGETGVLNLLDQRGFTLTRERF